ncbi:hypothetical protein [Paenibacillus amylolyticus]|uniref:hypothetical protein n=1 Tax=Paenibacillus amylolyticus TaxID=1451 RepID=UPI003390E2A1
MKHQPYIFAVSAVSGGGKTTMTNRLSELMKNSKALYFDDYEFEGEPEDICKWVEDGSDSNQWNLLPLIRDIQSLMNEPELDYIILDYPFAYSHNEMSNYINLSIFVDTPLDIAIARRILRDYTEHNIEEIKNDMMNYINSGRLAYLGMLQTTKPNSDIIIDGTLGLEEIVKRIIRSVEERRAF